MKRLLNQHHMKNLFYALSVLCVGLLTSTHEAVGQCSGTPIKRFEMTQVSHTTRGADNGSIEVAVQGGEGPFVYTLMIDHGGQGTQVISTSSPTSRRSYTFRKIPSNTSAGNLGYIIQVQSANGSDKNYPIALCQQRMISNIEVK